MNGLLILNKPTGPTSFAMVSHVRRLCHIRRVGHAGTLDPMASGVLLVLLGQATRIARYLESLDKEYQAVIRLGIGTDTDDLEGREISHTEVPSISREALAGTLQKFTGEIEQTPPLYSAVKKNGVPHYRLARRGLKVLPKSRKIRIHQIDLLGYDGRDLRIKIICSKGTYIRALARDIGRELGVGGVLAYLQRTAVGVFSLDRAVDFNSLDLERIKKAILNLDQALSFMPQRDLSEDEARAISHGASLATDGYHGQGRRLRLRYRGHLAAIAREEGGRLRPECVFDQSVDG